MYRLALLGLLALPLGACDSSDDPPAVTTTVANVLAPADTTTGVSGTVTFTQDGDRLGMEVAVGGLSPGAHGFRIHAVGNCGRGDHDGDGFAEAGGAAMGHHDPRTTLSHGAPGDDESERHDGELGNITASADGRAVVTLTSDDLSLGAERSVLGVAVMVHSMRDDLESDPGGMSGDRVGCAVIPASGLVDL